MTARLAHLLGLTASLALVEALDASEGRGTALPFRLVGAPGVDAHALARRLNALDLGVTARLPHPDDEQARRAAVRGRAVPRYARRAATRASPGPGPLHRAGESRGTAQSRLAAKTLRCPGGYLSPTPEAALAALAGWQASGEK